METKKCTKCGEVELSELFSRAADKRDGRKSHCKECVRPVSAAKARQYYSENSEKLKARSKAFRAQNADKVKAYEARYRAENAEILRARARRYYAENADERKAYQKRYVTENAGKTKARKARYRSENADKERAAQARYHSENANEIKARRDRRMKELETSYVTATLRHRFPELRGQPIAPQYIDKQRLALACTSAARTADDQLKEPKK